MWRGGEFSVRPLFTRVIESKPHPPTAHESVASVGVESGFVKGKKSRDRNFRRTF